MQEDANLPDRLPDPPAPGNDNLPQMPVPWSPSDLLGLTSTSGVVAAPRRRAIWERSVTGTYGPIVESAAILFVLWLACLWMYRQRIFVRI